MQRRGARPVVWPAKLLWAPLLIAGLWLMIHPTIQTDRVNDGGWRVVSAVGTPDAWASQPAFFVPGLILTILGVAAIFAYGMDLRFRAVVATEYPLFTAAAWIFGIMAILAWFRTAGHVAEVGTAGIDWRFLAYTRTEFLDYLVFGVAAAGCIACWIASWGPRSID